MAKDGLCAIGSYIQGQEECKKACATIKKPAYTFEWNGDVHDPSDNDRHPGCFIVDSGKWAGNCRFNRNLDESKTSARNGVKSLCYRGNFMHECHVREPTIVLEQERIGRRRNKSPTVLSY